MSVPPEVMQRMMAGAGGAGAGGAAQPPKPPMPGAAPGGAMQQATAPPAAAPISKPQDKKGLKAAAQTNVHIAVNMLEEALPAFGSESQEGGKILSALKTLSGLMGKRDSGDLVPAEVLQLARRTTQTGGGSDVQKQIQAMMQKQQQQPPPQAA